MIAIEHITIKGFKSIACIESLPPGQITAIIGPNGSGKSNFVEAFSFLHAIRSGRLRNYVLRAGGADRILYFGSKTTKQLTIHLSFKEEKNQYKIVLAATDIDEMYQVLPPEEQVLRPVEEVAYFWGRQKYSEEPYAELLSGQDGEAGISTRSKEHSPGLKKRPRDITTPVRSHLDRWRVYHFHDTSSSSPLKKFADVHDNRLLRPDGSNLAAVLYYLRKQHDATYELVRRTVQLVTPFFDDFYLEPMLENEEKIRMEWRHKNSDVCFHAASLSDGSLRFIALATLLLQPQSLRPSIILLDEPELGLHPYAITILAALIKQASTETQIVLATQSPLLIDHLQPEDVLVANRVKDSTRFERLDSSRLKKWLEDYSLGQLWEKNELGGRPVSE